MVGSTHRGMPQRPGVVIAVAWWAAVVWGLGACYTTTLLGYPRAVESSVVRIEGQLARGVGMVKGAALVGTNVGVDASASTLVGVTDKGCRGLAVS